MGYYDIEGGPLDDCTGIGELLEEALGNCLRRRPCSTSLMWEGALARTLQKSGT